MHRLGGLVGWFLSLLVVGLSFGLGVAVGWFLWGTRPDPRVPLQARGPAYRGLAPVEPDDAARPIDDLIADLVATPESVTIDITDAAMSGTARSDSARSDGARPDSARPDSARPEPAGSTAETAVIRPAATATIPAVRPEPATEVLPPARPTEVLPAAKAAEPTEVLPAVQVPEPTEVLPAAKAAEPTEVLPAVQVPEPTEVLPAAQVTEVIPAETPADDKAASETPAETEPADDLRRIEGIGPKLATALTAAGITRYAQLAESDPATVGATLRAQGIRFAPNIDTWIAQAKLLADGDEEGFSKLAAELVANRRARARR